nr:PREDICTED: uncharacterized protein LOC108212522 [Daucus carota subsp. sativus]
MASGSGNFNSHENDNQIANSSQFAQDNPLYLQSSDSPGMKLVSECFDGTGFGNWKRSMIIALSARNKLCFVDGSLPKPLATSSSFKSWSRCNDMVISWILGALSKSIGRSVIYCNSAHEMWKELDERYAVSNGAQLFGLHKEISEVHQGNSKIAEYFTKLKMLWDDVDALCMVPLCTCYCDCGAPQKNAAHVLQQRVIQFLMGLNESYNVMRGSILMTSPLPSISHVYNLLLQEEAQRDIHSASHFMSDAASLHVNSSRNQNFSSQGHGQTKNFKKSNIICNYCKKPGHVIDKCYRLHGFPSDFKFTKTPNKFAAQVDSGPVQQSMVPQCGALQTRVKV